MTTLTPYDGDTGEIHSPAVQNHGGRLLAINSIEQAVNLVDRICRTAFVPAQYRGKPEETLACILYGSELGIGPMQSLNSIDIVQGSVFLRAQLVQALARSIGGTIDVDEADADHAVVAVTRPGWSTARRVEFTFEEARRQGLTGKDPWKKDPAGMLVNRATTRAGRWYFADVLKGLYVEGDDFDTPPTDGAAASEPVEAQSIAELAEQRLAQLPATEDPAPVDVPLPLQPTLVDVESTPEGDDYLAWDYRKWTNECLGKLPLAEISATWGLRNFKAVADADPEIRTEIYLALVAASSPPKAVATSPPDHDEEPF